MRRLTSWRLARLASAYKTFNTVHDVLRLVSFWQHAVSRPDEERVLLCLQRAEAIAAISDDWGRIAIAYSDFFLRFNRHLRQNALNCMHKAEVAAKTSRDWVFCACAWFCLSDIDADGDAVRCLNTAVVKASTTDDFCNIAAYCLLLFVNVAGADVMMSEAERLATTRADWDAIREVYECGYYRAQREALAETETGLPFEIVDGRVVGTGRCAPQATRPFIVQQSS